MTASTRAGRRLILFSMWYFPSHFGLHVDDVARAFCRSGYDVSIITVSRPTFDLPYFDPFRDTFVADASEWHDVVRLNVERLEDRGAYNPHLFLCRDQTFQECRRRIESTPCYMLHFFEMFLPYFNSVTVSSALATSVMYAGNFVSRIASQRFGGAFLPVADQVVRELLERSTESLANGGYRLRGADCIFSETRELPRVLRSAGLQTPAYWTSRPIFAGPVTQAAPCHIHACFDIPRGARILLYAGRPSKNARILPAILDRVQRRCADERFFLLLVGVSQEEVAGWPGVSAQRCRIKAAPFVTRSALFGMMKSADVFVYPGLVDGYPKVISEAGLARVPVVAFNSPASAVGEMLRDGDTALMIDVASPVEVSESEQERFAAAIGRILSEPRLREALVARAFAAARRMDARHFVKRIERQWMQRQPS